MTTGRQGQNGNAGHSGGDEATLPLLENQQPVKKSTLLTVCPFILGNEFCERLAYYGLATNLVMYIINEMNGDPAYATIQVSLFEGTCYMTPLLGAYLADSRWGRYKTILVFSTIYLLGMLMLAASSAIPGLTPKDGEEASIWQWAALVGSLAVIALGTGGIKPNVSAFGADQFNEADPQDRREKESFFNWFYLAINVGSLIACTAIVYVQDSISWSVGFAIPAVAMIMSVVLFVGGRRVYKHVHPTESPLERVVRVVAAAIHNRYIKKHGAEVVPHPSDVNSLHGGSMFTSGLPNGGDSQPSTPGGATNRLPANGQDMRYDAGTQVPLSPSMSHRWLEDAITDWQTSQGQRMHLGGLAGHYTPQQVEEVKMVLRLMPVFLTTLFYWTIYTQMGSFFVQQGDKMSRDLPVGGHTLHLPSASMALFNTMPIIVLIPLYDKWLEPLIQRLRKGRKITLLQRIGWGMLLSVVSMVVAAWLEWWRLSSIKHCGDRNSPPALLDGAAGALHGLDHNDGGSGACSLNIFWQVPQYFVVGASEVLASIGQLEFFYDQAPDVMRSCSMSLQLLSVAIGSYLSGALVWIVQVASPKVAGSQWLPRDLNTGRLDLFFIFLAVLMAINTAAFVAVAMAYTYKDVEHKRRSQPRQPQLPAGAGGPQPQGGEPGRPALPTAAQPVGIRGGRRGGMGAGLEPTLEDLDMYGRSLAYVPPSPALPAPFR